MVRAIEDDCPTDAGVGPIYLLHLSDLHFRDDTPVSARVQWLLDDLKLDSGLGIKKLEYLVVSGDFTDKADAKGFERAYNFLSQLSENFGLSAERCILVPGNHDVSEPPTAFTNATDSKGQQLEVRDPIHYPLRFKPFSEGLHHKFVQKPYPMTAAEQGIPILFGGTRIQFLTFNSCWEIDKFDRRRAGIHPEAVAHAIKQAGQQVEEATKAGHLDATAKVLRIAVWHHAVTGPDCKIRDQSFLGNLQKNSVDVILHGDAHEIVCDEVGDRTRPKIPVVGAGSFGAPAQDKGEAIPRLYNVLEIERDFSAVTVHTRQQLTPDGDWSGYHAWPNPDGTDSRVPYYTIKLAGNPKTS